MKSKRGQITVQFNWIFVLVVGAIILLFFVGIINTQRELSQKKIAAVVLNDLEAIATGAEVSKGTAQLIDIPNLDIEFDCTDDCLCQYIIHDLPNQFKDKIIFAPNLVHGRKMVAWTKDWSMPFRVTNYLYLTSPEVRYIFLKNAGSEPDADEIWGDLPPNRMLIDGEMETIFNKGASTLFWDNSDVDTITDLNNYKVKFVFFNHPSLQNQQVGLANLKHMKNADVTAINVIPNAGFSFGDIIFYRKKGDKWNEVASSYYIMKPMIYAAIFGDFGKHGNDPHVYNCGVRETFRKMQIVDEIYWKRTKGTDSLESQLLGTDCEGLYNVNFFNEDPGIFLIQMYEGYPTPSSTTVSAQYAAISTRAGEIESRNRDIQLRSCPEIY
jgi:hypothetical protein